MRTLPIVRQDWANHFLWAALLTAIVAGLLVLMGFHVATCAVWSAAAGAAVVASKELSDLKAVMDDGLDAPAEPSLEDAAYGLLGVLCVAGPLALVGLR